MQDITELQARMDGALDRIAKGLAALGPATEGSSSLEGDLAAERELSASLQDRLRASRAEYEERIAAMEAELAETRRLLASVEEDRGRLRAASDTLRTTCERLRKAAAENIDAELINGAMQTEIEALGAARRSDRAELDAIVSLLGEDGERNHG